MRGFSERRKIAFGEWIQVRRKELGLRQEDLAVACQGSKASVGLWERGKVIPQQRAQDLLAAALHVDPAELRARMLGKAIAGPEATDTAVYMSPLAVADLSKIVQPTMVNEWLERFIAWLARQDPAVQALIVRQVSGVQRGGFVDGE